MTNISRETGICRSNLVDNFGIDTMRVPPPFWLRTCFIVIEVSPWSQPISTVLCDLNAFLLPTNDFYWVFFHDTFCHRQVHIHILFYTLWIQGTFSSIKLRPKFWQKCFFPVTAVMMRLFLYFRLQNFFTAMRSPMTKYLLKSSSFMAAITAVSNWNKITHIVFCKHKM